MKGIANATASLALDAPQRRANVFLTAQLKLARFMWRSPAAL